MTDTTPILVTGATGNVGGALTELLAAAGHPVRAAGRSARDLPQGVAFSRLDFLDPTTYAPTLEGVRRVFLIRPPAISDVRRDLAPFLSAMERAGVTHVVFLSLLGVERNRIVPHRAIEDLLRASRMDWTMLRAGFFMQNLSTTHRDEIRDLAEIIVPAGHGRTSFVDVRDLAEVAALALTEPGHRGKAYPLSGAVALDYAEVAATMSAVLGRPISYRQPSLLRFVRHWLAKGTKPAYIAVMAVLYTTARLGLAATITPDLTRLLARPPRSLRTFVEDNRHAWDATAAGKP